MMQDRELGEHILFIISLPRSGSTLVQHILASHSTVAATAEPWILYPSALALRSQALSADYNANIGYIALTDFLKQLDGGQDEYYAAVRKMALHLYNAFLIQHGKERFLDKTSRYYLILPELFQIFPKAKYIFLLRNPLAVFTSFLESMVSRNWTSLGRPGIRNDLLDGYQLVRQGIRYFGDDAIVVKYEDLVNDPETVVQRMCKCLDLEFELEMLRYGDQVGVLSGKLVDTKSIHQHQIVVKDYRDAWRSKLTTRQERHLAQAFLTHLGVELTNSLGYSYQELANAIPKERQGWTPLPSWQTLMTPTAQKSWLQRRTLELLYIWQKKGTSATLKQIGGWAVKLGVKSFGAGWKRTKNLSILRPIRQRVRDIRNRFYTALGKRSVSSDYRVVVQSQVTPDLLRGWQVASVAEQQFMAYHSLLKKMYKGEPRQDFVVAAQALHLTKLTNPTILEVGCGNGYYSEVLAYLTRRSITYTGLDYSWAMIESAQDHYPDHNFIHGDATHLPVADIAYDVVWSGTVLMHLADYGKCIAESCRAARRFCIFHSTPVLVDGLTTFLSKKAYGMPVVEVIINQAEFENLVRAQGFVIRHVLESLPYNVDKVKGTVHTLTYICERVL
ncbi:MAG: methyltransferase domain-containing protein [Chloroflexi bacterium]|nr:methyltransferase domain-containing protein [Chloroflexota bacterium]